MGEMEGGTVAGRRRLRKHTHNTRVHSLRMTLPRGLWGSLKTLLAKYFS